MVKYIKCSTGSCGFRVGIIRGPGRSWCRLFSGVWSSEVFIRGWIQTGASQGIAVSATSAGVDDDKVEPLRVSEGENLTISIHVKKSDEEPQVLVTRLTGSSQEPIAQLICHNRSCERKCWISGVSLMYDRENLTLILVNVSFNQTGRYAVNTLSSTPPQNKIYNLTVCQTEPRRSTVSPEPLPSVTNRKSFAGVTSAIVFVSVLLIIVAAAVVVVVFYLKSKKANSYKMAEDDDTAASSRSGSFSVRFE